jgi:hypothetical protein
MPLKCNKKKGVWRKVIGYGFIVIWYGVGKTKRTGGVCGFAY